MNMVIFKDDFEGEGVDIGGGVRGQFVKLNVRGNWF